ncbi:MAG: HDOD domain-containing protein [Leptothrix sp. (in: b-proteobacteria)]
MSLSARLRSLDVDLPACPRTLLELLALLDDDQAPIGAMSRLIESDMALASAVVRTVNTAMFGLLRRVDTVGDALLCLGTREVAAITFSIALRAAFPPTPQLRHLWEHASRCGLLMGRSAPALGLDALRAHTAGLFARSGQAVLLVNSDGLYPKILAAAGDDQQALIDAERAAFGLTHAAYGSALCAAWGLASDVVKYVHERIEPPQRWLTQTERVRELLALGAMAEQLLAGEDADAAAATVAPGTGLSSQRLSTAVRAPWSSLNRTFH